MATRSEALQRLSRSAGGFLRGFAPAAAVLLGMGVTSGAWALGTAGEGVPASADFEALKRLGQHPEQGALMLPVDTLGDRLFRARCASCHTDEPGYAPARSVLEARTVESLVGVMTHGAMRNMVEGLNETEIHAIAAYLSAPQLASDTAPAEGGFCRDSAGPIQTTAASWNGWSPRHDNSRFQPNPGLSVADIPRLRVKWSFGYNIRSGVFSQPTVVGDRIFVSSLPGNVYSLDRDTGCIHWSYETGPGARTAVVIGTFPTSGAASRQMAFVGDNSSWVHAIDAQTGEEIWRVQVETHTSSRISGSPVLHEGILYMPVSSLEEATAANESYPCCTFRGSVVALDAATGAMRWKSYTIPDEPREFGRTSVGVPRFGPSGAAIWGAPTLDLARNVLYVATGNSYTDESEQGSRSVIAMDLSTGAVRWSTQVAEDDNYLVACLARPQFAEVAHANCPDHVGPDHDFGASPILKTLPNGRQVLLAADKAGIVYAMDPDADGRLIWNVQVGHGSTLGGVQWGMAADDELVYVGVADDRTFPRENARPGVSAIQIATGEVMWQARAPVGMCSWSGDIELCGNGYSAALTLVPGAVFAPNLDGHIRAYSAGDGKLLWAFDTARIYETVNGRRAHGGSLDATGVTVVDGMVLLNSGYDRFTRRSAGNVLVAFTVDGR